VTGSATAQQARPRPDASMALLADLAADALESDYAVAAARRADRPASPLWRHGLLIGGVAAVGLLLALAANEVRIGADAASAERAALAARVRDQGAHVAELESEVASLRGEVATLQGGPLQGLGEQVQARTAALAVAVGAVEMSGPGVVVVLADSPAADGTGGTGRVLDVDIQRTVNGLWAAGAEAVAVGDERLAPLTAIRSANDVVLVNYEPVAPPYEIRAIGDPDALRIGLLEGDAGDWLATIAASEGIRYSVRSVDRTTVPAGPEPTLRHATQLVPETQP
jgi:uncharacterized protein YlxW (UPF0749 family)